MEQFKDANGLDVHFSYRRDAFSPESGHVLVICRHGEDWVFTRHKRRGLEFPGGKREDGESLEEAAIRETYEETGAVITEPAFIGEYKVHGDAPFVKTIFFGEVTEIIDKEDYLETDGIFLWNGDWTGIQDDPSFSFIMKDRVIELALKKVTNG
ncbi:RNA deprotection pyrophosphohydrolase [Rossellomorea marisflavi]|uniref:RNA deprotection pyrophosphohydrolase n=1 Tax=Rossellomorea marisflavi TaxID=189381 RepID=UPI001EE37B26|nr:nucleoside triphosphatase YtkD [Rossellomorea marisflavi]UKS64406.1 nucleoside triphosphatase YtkD [Rossellomorea marisflavi]